MTKNEINKLVKIINNTLTDPKIAIGHKIQKCKEWIQLFESNSTFDKLPFNIMVTLKWYSKLG